MAAPTSVWVGNIPYEATEEELIKFFSAVGDVKNFHLITDQNTGRSKGFGFCYFLDAAAAESAVRNLSGQPLRDRPLRVDLATPRSQREPRHHGHHHRHDHGHDHGHGRSAHEPARKDTGEPEAKRSKLYGESGPAGGNASKIADTLEKAPVHKVHQTMKQMKGFAMKQPREARALLASQPQLAYAFVKALLRLGMIDTTAADKLTSETPQSALLPTGPPPPAPAGVPAAREQRMPARDVYDRGYERAGPPPPQAAPVARREAYEPAYPPYDRHAAAPPYDAGRRGGPPPPHRGGYPDDRRDRHRHPEHDAGRRGAPPPPPQHMHAGRQPPMQPAGVPPPPPHSSAAPSSAAPIPGQPQLDKKEVIETALRMSEEEISRMPAHLADALRKIRRKFGMA
ncbi:hypothetical protein PTSG_08350 [Salpingoeca rosetta]|uniref:RRM domain-containing protein n=1 Tax=Salpingoeca rosetta (strain ATCC 50818 / BSB-021) TaxID=946362 RepID=F2UJF8_SALR5|nr:uncharacterized protein PTSG_08350 [Salpingoeca rosetta]EGD77257.1 hypothetical protein PTSG_08350 [Salpingoeca rosetta]|eukprot:XP_004990601.1 hypothetical protein PTSG_08350 [Salpingoeca rosetta]